MANKDNRHTLGISLEELLKQKTAGTSIAQHQETDPDPACNFFKEGVRLLKAKHPFEALTYLFAAKAIDSSDQKAANNIVVAFWQLDCPQLAIKTAREILTIDPQNARAQNHLELLTSVLEESGK